MIYAQIQDSVIKNMILIEDESMIPMFSDGFDDFIRIDELNPRPGPGWSWDGEDFSPPAPIIDLEIKDVTPRQMRQALILSGVSMDTIETALNSLSEPLKSLAIVEWEYSIAFQRHRPLVETMGAMLGWSSDQLDNLWRFAATL